MDDEELMCEKHGRVVEIVDEGSNTGFAGGQIYWAELSCGCYLMDESDDIAAAI